ncbi:MAG TPA: hypothetical protein VKG89_09060 [Solirubrobacterales bacterium]|nr:hypothetical protein [Solirubrobacterales bacterium]
MTPRRLVVLGTAASHPYAGMAWMQMQIAAGLLRLGHDVHYLEATSTWPYDPVRRKKVDDSSYVESYLARIAPPFGLGDRWAHRRGYSDGEWIGPSEARADALLAGADAVLNVAGSTRIRSFEGLPVGRLVYLGTDPPSLELALANDDPDALAAVEEHDDFVTYGENIGTTESPVPGLPKLRARTRQPVLLDMWDGVAPTRREFTTVSNWRQTAYDAEFCGQTYLWSKHHEWMRFADLPRRTGAPLELATSLANGGPVGRATRGHVPASGMTPHEVRLLEANGWRIANAHRFTTDPWAYRDYVRSSRAEFSVARDQNVRLRSGWFSERSACYLASGRPVVAQDTGFGATLPTGEGLFAFETPDQVAAAFEAIDADYERHSSAAREIAQEYFRAEAVLARMLADLGL